MESYPPEELPRALARMRPPAVTQVVLSDAGRQLYTVCGLSCLGNTEYAVELFKRVMRRSLARPPEGGEPLEDWLFAHYHAVWGTFAKRRPDLGPSAVPMRLDWGRFNPRQARDALYTLTPPEREIFLFRFLLIYPDTRIARLTGLRESRVRDIFHGIIRKMVQ